VKENYGFSGGFTDGESGLINHWQLWANPATGNWMSQDPLGFQARDPNLQRYVGNDPTRFRDPQGMDKIVPKPGPDGEFNLYYVNRLWWTLLIYETAELHIGTLYLTGENAGWVEYNGYWVRFSILKKAVDDPCTPQSKESWMTWFKEHGWKVDENVKERTHSGEMIRLGMYVTSDLDERTEMTLAMQWLAEQGVDWFAWAGFNVSASAFAFMKLWPKGATIAGTRGLQHSFGKHAAEWFTMHGGTATMEAWQKLIESAACSKKVVEWSLRGQKTVGHLARIDGTKWFFVQFWAEGAHAGELATAFIPNKEQLAAILKLLGII
jgi:RHS repeat-associated protein